MDTTGTLMMLGAGIQAGSKIAAGRSAQEAGDYNAAALERQGAEERAAAQRTAIERRKATDRLISKQVAIGAASGSALSSPGLLDIIGDTAQEGEYRAQADMYVGESRARGLKDKANIARYEGENAYTGSLMEGISGLALGVGKYGLPTRTTPIGPWRTTVSYG